MDTFDKFLKQYSYKFDKGYPNMDNPKDKEKLLEFAYKLTEKKTVLNEQQTEYDTEIKKALEEVRERSAKDYIDCIVKLLPYVTPKLLAAQINEEKTHKIEINLSNETTASDLKKMLGEDDGSVEDINFEDL